MNEITLKAETQPPGRTTLPGSLLRWQRLAGSLVGIPSLPPTMGARKHVLSELKAALWAAGPEYVSTAMLRLQGHYWRPDFSPAQAKELYVDYIDDLSELPPDILDAAIRQYRCDPDAKFFPRTGDLLGIARPMLEERRRAIMRLERSVSAPVKDPDFVRTPEELARVKQAIKDAFKPFEEGATR